MTRFVFSPAAADDLNEIWEYIARDDIDAADRFRDQVYDAVGRLAEMPRMGHRREDLANKAIRVWSVGNYLIFYDPESKPLEIVRILSGYRDVEALFESS